MKRTLACAVVISLVGVTSCTTDRADESAGDKPPTTDSTADLDYTAIGLWNDGHCDKSLKPLVIGMMTVFESPVLSLGDQALALEAAAIAFNKRGGANGSCIEVHTCDDKADPEQALECVREISEAGVVATVNDQGLVVQDDVAEAMTTAGIPRIAGNVTNLDWSDANAYPLDASGTGVAFLLPQTLIDKDISKIATIRVGLAAGAALNPIFEGIYKGEATFPADLPVAAGTTDFSQYILGATAAGAVGAILALGEQEAIQVVRAGQQLNTDLILGSSLGSFSHSNMTDLGDFAEQMAFVWSFAPATADLPVYEALRADLAASGEKELQPLSLKTSPMRSWIGLYALLKMIRDARLTDFTGQSITAMLHGAKDVPMLGIFGDENWTPNLDHPGLFKRAGTSHWATYRWDPDVQGPFNGNFVETSELDFDKVLCGSPIGGAEPC